MVFTYTTHVYMYIQLLVCNIVPVPSVNTNTLNNQIVGQSLLLECDVITVRGITSSVDIVWSSNGSELSVTEGVNISSETNESMLFTDIHVIPQLNTTDENKEYQCEVFINTELPVIATDSVILNVTGKHVALYTL